MRVCLIKPIGRHWDEEQYFIDIGLGFLGSSLKRAGLEVFMLDCMRSNLNWDKYEKFIRDNCFDVYCFKVYSHGIGFVNRSIEIIRRINPRAFVGVGGPHPTGVAEEIFEHIPQTDFAWQSESEIWFPKFLSEFERHSPNNGNSTATAINLSASTLANFPGLIYRSNGGIHANPPYFHQSLDDFGFPDWEMMDFKNYVKNPNLRFICKYYVPVITSRGCPMSCSYCQASKLSGKEVRRHSVEYVIGWIKELHKLYGVNYFAFVDDALTLDKKYFFALLEGINRLDFKIHWDCAQNAIRFDNLDEEMIRLMEKSGCFCLNIAIESGSPSTLNSMKRKVNLDVAREKIHLIKNTSHMILGAYFILGFPDETCKDLKATTRFSRELPLDKVEYFLFTPHPGTEIYNQLREQNKLTNMNWSNWHYNTSTVPLKDISLKKLNIYKQWSKIRFDNRLKYFFKKPVALQPFLHTSFFYEIKRLFRSFGKDLLS